MKRKGKKRRILSGMMAAVSILSSVLSPFAVCAAETEEKPPLYEEVKELLDADEVVKAKDYEMEVGCSFDPSTDFSGLEIPDNQKVKVTFQEAKNDAGEDFSTSHADMYTSVYYVEPLTTEHPVYQISRKLIVVEATDQVQSENVGGQSADAGETDHSDDDGETELSAEAGQHSDAETPMETASETEAVLEEKTEISETDMTAEEPENVPGETEAVSEEEIVPGEGETASEAEDLTEEPEAVSERMEDEAETEPVSELVEMQEETIPFTEEVENEFVLETEMETSANLIMLAVEEEAETEVETETETENEDPVPDKFKLVNTNNWARVPVKYSSTPEENNAATRIRRVVFYDDDGNTVKRNAYCLQPILDNPSGGTYDKDSDRVVVLESTTKEKNLAKCLYYMYGGPAWGKSIDYADGSGSANMQSIMQDYGCSTNSHFFAVTHYVLGYFYVGASGNWNANTGVKNVMNSAGEAMIADLASYIKKLPVPQTTISATSVTTTYNVSTGVNVSKTLTYNAIEENTATIALPDGITLVNETTGTSATGTVILNGGVKFHLEASPSIVGTGSYALNCKYAVDFTAMALKTPGKQDIGFSYYSGDKILAFSVEWPEQAEVSIKKKDAVSGKNLAGAVYGIYSDAACTSLIVQMPATDSNGASAVTINKTQDTVYLKEISAPNGYVLNTSIYNINLIAGDTVTQNVTNKEQLAKLTVYKNGEMLTGANVSDAGVSFVYTEQRQKGAVYNIYAGADIVAADGTIVYKKGALVKSELTTGADGSAVLDNLHLGTYLVEEQTAPVNLVCTKESKQVVLSYAGANVETVTGEVSFTNSRQTAEISVSKVDQETKNPLDGGIYGLYAENDILNCNGEVVVKKDTLIEKVTTDENGNAAYSADLPIGNEYYIKELRAPSLYYRNSEDVYSFDFQYTNDKEASESFTHVFQNQRVDATIFLVKKDAEKGEVPQGDATLEGAVYGLYAREDVVHPDGKMGILYKAGDQVATLTTDKDGKAEINGLYLGHYYVKELAPSVGYLVDEQEHDVVCDYEGDQKVTIERTVESHETVIKQPFQVIKVAMNGKTDADLLEGAGFSAYLVSSLSIKEDGSYDFSSAEPVVLTENDGTEMFTDENGYACSIPLPYGTYMVRETTTPHNYTPVDDFIVSITANDPTKPQVWRVLLDDEFEAKLKIIKKDDETKKAVLLADTEFKVYDLDNKKYVEQVTIYPVTTVHKSYFTDSDGYLILPQSLSPGNYEIQEVAAPYGYALSEQPVQIKVDSNTAYLTDPVSGDILIEVSYENQPVKGELTIQKQGEILSGYDGAFDYEENGLAGAVFEIYAAEDIYTADRQTGEDGSRIRIYGEGTLVGTVTTDETGKAVIGDLPLGKYRVSEKATVDGFVLSDEIMEVTFAYADQHTTVIKEEITFKNERQKAKLSVEKQDAQTGKVLAGAVFGLYNAENIVVGDKVIVEADTLLEQATSDDTGLAVFTLDLPLGHYYVKELAAPDGYVSSDETLEFDASYQGDKIPVVELVAVMKNDPTVVEVTKSDVTTSVELDGATLTVTDQDRNVIDTWVSVKEEPHVIKNLIVGKSYFLKEEFAPYGYLQAEEIEFTVADTKEIQKVEMQDAVPTGRIIINKKGEFVNNVDWNHMVAGGLEYAFSYITGGLKDITFEIYAVEDIKAADGVSTDYYKKDDLVATITTDQLGYARADGLPLGKYYVVEKETVEGFVLDDKARAIDLTYRDQFTDVVTYDSEWQNARQKVKVTVLKKEKGSERVLEGAVFALCVGEDIVSAKGEVLLKADTVIEQKTTDKDGTLTFAADLPVGTVCYVKELKAEDGFVTTGEVQEFTFEYQGSDVAVATYEFVFENEPTTVAITKADLTTCEELPGAHLRVIDENANLVDEWISTDEPHFIKELVVGKSYTLIETKPADGYVTAESIDFTVENTAEIQKHEMLDDVTKVQISKTDITGTQEIPGARLTLFDEDGTEVESWISGEEPHYIEKLPVGTYKLREEQAAKGYVTTEDVEFEVCDTGEIQKVVMVNETAKGKLWIYKTDKETKEPLKGVTFELRNNKGKVLETLVTDAEGKAESSLLDIATFKEGVYQKALKYTLVETKPLDGYVLDETEHEIQFTYEDDKTPVIEVKLELANEKADITEEPPKTGDDTDLWLPVLLMVLSVTVFAGAWRKRKKKAKVQD